MHILSNCCILLTLLQNCFADIDQQIQQSVDGCTVGGNLQKGLTGTIYQMQSEQSLFTSDANFYKNGAYSANSKGSFVNTQGLNFNFGPEISEIYGVELDNPSFVLEEAALFQGMYLIHFFFVSETFTNTLLNSSRNWSLQVYFV